MSELLARRKSLVLGLLALPLLGGALFVRVRWEQERAVRRPAAHHSHGSPVTAPDPLPEVKRRAEMLPNDPAAQAQLAMALLASGRAAEADRTMRRAVELAPRAAPYHLGRARTQLASGDDAGALRSVEEAVKRAGSTPELLLEAGKICQDLDRYTEARRLYEQVCRIEPHRARPRLFLGQYFLKLDSPGEALAQFREAARHEPELAGAHLACADAALRMGRLKEAEKAAARAIELEPENPAALQVRALIYLQDSAVSDAPAKARRLLERAAQLGSADAVLYYNLGRAAMRVGDAEAAALAFSQAIQRDPRHLAARMNLARAYQRLGRMEEAQALLKEVQPLLETSLELTQLQARVRRDPTDADAHFRLGRIFLAQGQRDLANARFRKALLADPEHGAARKALAEVRESSHAPGGSLE